MPYSKLYFGKELNDLTYQNIEEFFIYEKEESDKIEFKSYYSKEEKNHTDKENGIIRAICALLNSEGGLIIWGAPVGQTVSEKKEKIFKGDLSPIDKLIEKDSFISKITDLITPSPRGVKFQLLEKSGLYIYIIEVEQSPYSPHQFRNTYYMRIDGQTKPAPHHYIEALFRKVSFPKLEGYLKLDSIRNEGNRLRMQITTMIFNKSKLQNEFDVYYRVIIDLGKFAQYGVYKGNDKVYTLEGHEIRSSNAKSTLYYNEPFSDSEIIYLDCNELIKNNNECNIFFYFGGKHSPLMISEYKLKINNNFPDDLNNLIVSMEENKYSYEKSDKLQKTEKEIMKSILGR